MMRLLCLTLLLFAAAPAAAQDTDPFPLPHPQTGEPGEWTPQWLVREHLRIEAALRACTETSGLRLQQIAKLELSVELAQRALAEEKASSAATQTALTHTSLRLRESEDTSATKTTWLWITGSTATVAIVTAVLIGALQ